MPHPLCPLDGQAAAGPSSRRVAPLPPLSPLGTRTEQLMGADTEEKEEQKEGWDYAIVLNEELSHDAKKSKKKKKFFRKSRAERCKKLVRKLERAGLVVGGPTLLGGTDNLFITIRAPEERLMEEAELSGMFVDLDPRFGIENMPAHPERLESFPTESFTKEGYAAGRFLRRPGKPLFGSGQRIVMTYNIIRKKKGAGLNKGAHLRLEKMIEKEEITLHTPLHNLEELDALKNRWRPQWYKWWIQDYFHYHPGHIPGQNRLQLVTDVRDYFGEQLAFYFAFLGFYTLGLVPLAGLTVPFMIAGWATSYDNYSMVFFCVAVVLWSSIFIKFWERNSANLRYEWDVESNKALGYKEQVRPEFSGPEEPGFYSEGGWLDLSAYEQVVPRSMTPQDWQLRFQGPLHAPRFNGRHWFHLLNMSLILLCLGFLVAVVISLLVFKIWSENLGEDWGPVVAGLLNGLSIQLLNFVYEMVAIKLTDLENHRTVQDYENHLIGKQFGFQFINNYGTLLYITFIKPVGEDEELEIWGVTDGCHRERGADDENGTCYEQLEGQLIGIVASKVIVDAVLDILLPWIMGKWKRYQLVGEIGLDTGDVEFIEAQLTMNEYTSSLWDFNQLVLTYGFVAMFAVAWPGAVLVVSANGLLQWIIDSTTTLAN
eukprot:TRINITY_DN11714_c0_g1_i6.p1 TRINITY_DN11714_c0_g1~~TRINITY_DN11714_c0_g1_i6.p1  ORF type:complete len:654 (+),score=169.07 TRINITY_DN11714_c0_g1_i6:238-2199(+)